MIKFRDKEHEEEFKELLMQTELTDQEIMIADDLLKRQIAFFYLIALYQEEYLKYEGCKFYVEVYEDISLDGPTYLLSDEIEEVNHAHEKMIKVAKALLQGKEPNTDEIEVAEQEWIKQAMTIATDGIGQDFRNVAI